MKQVSLWAGATVIMDSLIIFAWGEVSDVRLNLKKLWMLNEV